MKQNTIYLIVGAIVLFYFLKSKNNSEYEFIDDYTPTDSGVSKNFDSAVLDSPISNQVVKKSASQRAFTKTAITLTPSVRREGEKVFDSMVREGTAKRSGPLKTSDIYKNR